MGTTESKCCERGGIEPTLSIESCANEPVNARRGAGLRKACYLFSVTTSQDLVQHSPNNIPVSGLNQAPNGMTLMMSGQAGPAGGIQEIAASSVISPGISMAAEKCKDNPLEHETYATCKTHLWSSSWRHDLRGAGGRIRALRSWISGPSADAQAQNFRYQHSAKWAILRALYHGIAVT
jgi:hypothetical protein